MICIHYIKVGQWAVLSNSIILMFQNLKKNALLHWFNVNTLYEDLTMV